MPCGSSPGSTACCFPTLASSPSHICCTGRSHSTAGEGVSCAEMWQAFNDGHFPYSPVSDYRELRLLHSHFDGIHDTILALTDTSHIPTHLEALLSCQFEEKWKVHQWSKNAFCGPLLFTLGCSLQGLFWNVFALGFEVFQKKKPRLYLHLLVFRRKDRIICFVCITKMHFIVIFSVLYSVVLHLFV